VSECDANGRFRSDSSCSTVRGMDSVPTGHIVAIGGARANSQRDSVLLDDFVLSLARRKPARVCLIPTASGDSTAHIVKFYRTFSARCLASDLTLTDYPTVPRRPASTRDLEDFVAEQDVFYVTGGSTLNLLALWRAHGLDVFLRKAWQAGAVLSGISAGMNCWFEACLTDSFGGLEALRDGLGFLKGSACPHYDGETMRRPKLHDAILGGLPAAYAADDGAALHFIDGEFAEAVASHPDARAYRVHLREGQLLEEPIPTRFLAG
jgi:dipeptidase E